MLIRREAVGDHDTVRAVHAAAFRRPDAAGATPIEAKLVDDLRAGESWIIPLSLVAEQSGEVIGHVVCSRGWIDDRPALGLGPIGVVPEHQRRGVGSALVHAVLGAADALGEPIVVLLGDPGYYRRFGFELASRFGIAPPVATWEPHFQARPLTTYDAAVHGTFAYPAAFPTD